MTEPLQQFRVVSVWPPLAEGADNGFGLKVGDTFSMDVGTAFSLTPWQRFMRRLSWRIWGVRWHIEDRLHEAADWIGGRD